MTVKELWVGLILWYYESVCYCNRYVGNAVKGF